MEPFKIEKTEELGRFGVANRDLSPGEVFFEEVPFACGPLARSQCCCLECYSPVDPTLSGSRCENCSWPLCQDCRKLSELHAHKRECDLFKAAKCKFFNLTDPNGVCIQLDCIVPLRVLLEKEANPERWNEDVEPMEHHRDKRFGTASWNADANNVVGYLLGPCKLKQLGIEGELIQRIIGVLEVNTFEGKTEKGYSIRCLFPKIAILCHSCTPNTTHSIHPTKGYRFQLRASTAIKKGEMLFATYTYTLNGTAERQAHLLEGKYFQCHCERCLDPTELGIHFSSLKCQQCHSGFVVASNPLDSKAVWRCNKCSFEDTAENVRRLLKALQDEIESTNAVESMENLLEKYKSILHSNHFIMISLKNALIDSYGHIKGYLLSQLPDALLRRKIKLCEEVLEILDVFERGKSRARGLMMFELHAPIVLLARSLFRVGGLSKSEYLVQLEKARDILSESLEILSGEDESFCKALVTARVSMKVVENLIEDAKQVE